MLRTALIGLFVCALVACTTSESSEPAETTVATVNTQCPMMGKPVAAEGGTADYHGQTIGFCCGGCSDDFAALSDVEKVAKLASVDVKVDG